MNKWGQIEVPKYFYSDTTGASVGSGHSCAIRTSPLLYTFSFANQKYRTNMHCWGSNIDAQIDIPHETYIEYLQDTIRGDNHSQNQNQNQRHNHTRNVNNMNNTLSINSNSTINNNNNDFINLNYVKVVAGGDHTCVMGANNFVKCFGHCQYSVCDIRNLNKYQPSQQSQNESIDADLNFNKVYSIFAGGLHNCIQYQSSLVCFGSNKYGQTDIPSIISGEPLHLFNDYTLSLGMEISCSLYHGLVVTWGSSQFINTDTFYENSIYKPLAFQISSGWTMTCMSLFRGHKLCTGDNSYGQSTVPVQANDLSEIAAGAMHVCSIDLDGRNDYKKRKLICWGNNTESQILY